MEGSSKVERGKKGKCSIGKSEKIGQKKKGARKDKYIMVKDKNCTKKAELASTQFSLAILKGSGFPTNSTFFKHHLATAVPSINDAWALL